MDWTRLPLSRSSVDRHAERRTDPDLIAEAWRRSGTQVVVVAGGMLAVRVVDEEMPGAGPFGGAAVDHAGGAPAALELLSPVDLTDVAVRLAGLDPSGGVGPGDDTSPDLAAPDLATSDLAEPDLAASDVATPDMATPDLVASDLATPDVAAALEGLPAVADGTALLAFLGADEVDLLALVLPDAESLPGEHLWRSLRDVGYVLDDREVGLASTAVALAAWHRRHPRCPLCGAATVPAAAGWTRTCVADGSEHYPRTDPAVIMAVVDDEDRLLLAHSPQWPARRFSTLAGFVEPGESAEAAVAREVGEEVGVAIGEVAYRGSQSWPFPGSLMLAYRARAASTEITVDEVEIAEAHWFSRPQLLAAVTAGEVLLPTRTSIARALIEEWFGGPIESEAWGTTG
ncbi:NAD(+) diphosphatase [Actinotalea sp.]|uniref:NAD(+) diphosphatase n=1 Tax=Actinotalea sp. TaxID=1872145 RepID=UPI003561F0FD